MPILHENRHFGPNQRPLASAQTMNLRIKNQTLDQSENFSELKGKLIDLNEKSEKIKSELDVLRNY